MIRPMRISFAPVLAAALMLGGCGSNRGVESIHQPVVSRADYVFDVATVNYGLAPGEAQRLAGWMTTMNLSYGDQVYLDDPTSDPGVRGQIAAELSRYGLFVNPVAPVTTGAIVPGTARVILSRMTATVPNCPNWRKSDFINFDGHTSENYGCAVNSNLAAMVARPQDLVRGQPGADTADPATAIKAIDQYRKAPPTGAGGLQEEATGGGN